MPSRYSVTIIGGTGGLGPDVSNAFLTDFRKSFSRVRVLTRDAGSAKAQELHAKGAELHTLDEGNLRQALDAAFDGADAIVNMLPGGASPEVKQAAIQAASRSSAKVYFLSEFGTDHRSNDFPGYEHPEWDSKKKIEVETREALVGKKVIALYNSVFLELPFTGPFLGFDLANNTYTSYGPSSQKMSTTSKADIGRAVARLAILALDPTTAATVPDNVRIAGDTVSYEGVRDLFARIKGVPEGQLKTEDLAEHKKALRENPGLNFLEYLRVVIGEGKMDHSSDNSNGLVNPGESFWKWFKVEDVLRGF